MTKEIILEYSGGKDSRAVLELLIPVSKKVVVYFLNTGYMFPHVLENIYRTCEQYKFDLVEISPPRDILDYQAEFGIPSDMLSSWNNFKIWKYLHHQPPVMLQDAMECCYVNIMRPLHEAVVASGIKQVWRGSKITDSKVGVPHGYVDEFGIKYMQPLWTWTDAEVFAFLKSRNVDVLEHYLTVSDSTQCWHCTADLHFGGAERIAFTREKYPDLYEKMLPRILAVRDEVRRQMALFDASITKAGVW